MKSRKEELERKRQKLAELRRSREERKNALLSAQQRKEATAATIISKDRKAIDELVASLVGDLSSPKNEVSSRSSTPTLLHSEVQTHSTLSSPGLAASAPVIPTEFPSTSAPPKKEKPLMSSEVLLFDFPPTVVYNKEIQTDVFEEVTEKEEGDGFNLESEIMEPETETKKIVKEVIKEEKKITEFSEEEKKNIMQTEGFKDFFDYSTKIVERALDEPYDFMVDYRLDNTVEDDMQMTIH